MTRHVFVKLAAMMVSATAIGASAAYAQSSTGQITVLYDAFGKTSTMKKDWGFSALIEYGGKRILFDTGNNAEIFAHNVAAKRVDLKKLDFAIVSHRHGDHTSGLNPLLSGQNLNKFSWLSIEASSHCGCVTESACGMGIFSNRVTERICSKV